MADRETTIKLTVQDNFSAQLRAFATALDQSEKAAGDTAKKMSTMDKVGNALKDNIGKLAIGGFGALTAAMGYSINRAMEAEQIMAKTSAVIKSTGGVAGYTADEVGKMAKRFSEMSAVDDETVQSAENVMLTFTSIGKETFPQAMEAALNMSAALGQDLQSSVIQVGKALQDPINGLTALRRVGVNFNNEAKDTVKHMVEMGDTAGAQKFILAELSKEFGGVAEAMGNTAQGKINKARIALDNMAEAIGQKLLPVLGKAADAATTLIEWNEKLGDAYKETAKNITDQKTTYDDYKRSLIATAEAAGLVHHQYRVGEGDVVTYDDKVQILTEEQWNATRGAYGLAGALDESNRAAARAAESHDALAEATANSAQASAEYNQTTAELIINTHELTKETLFKIATQDMDAESALRVARSMGLVDEETAANIEKQRALLQQYKNGTLTLDQYIQKTHELGAAIGALPDYKSITIEMMTSTGGIAGTHGGATGDDVPAPSGNTKPKTPTKPKPKTTPKGGGHEAPMSATGSDFVVPPGYPNDSFNMRVQSGERVIVMPPQQQRQGGGVGANITINVSGAGDPETLAQKISQILARRLRAASGNPGYAGV